MLKSEAQVKFQHIPYKGSGPALIDLMAGRVVGMIDALGPGMPHVKSGKLNVLALTAAEHAPEFQTIPTFKEAPTCRVLECPQLVVIMPTQAGEMLQALGGA